MNELLLLDQKSKKKNELLQCQLRSFRVAEVVGYYSPGNDQSMFSTSFRCKIFVPSAQGLVSFEDKYMSFDHTVTCE